MRWGFGCEKSDNCTRPTCIPRKTATGTGCTGLRLPIPGGTVLIVFGQPAFDFGASFHTPENLEAARHTTDLARQDFITVHLDHRQHGLGSASCGPDVLEPYRLYSGDFEFAFRLKPWSDRFMSPFGLARQTFDP